ncbi:MAG TPA: transposase [Holophaga sp.]|nr:transposase [Holophaga sp.]
MKILEQFKANLERWRGAFKQDRTFGRVTRALVALLASHGRSTLTNAITFKGTEQADWSADYKAFNRAEWVCRDLFRAVLEEGIHALAPEAPVVVAMDDTSLPKVGQKIPQARWCHDPLAPKFLDKQIRWGIRMLHAALLIPDYHNHRPLAISTAFEPVPAAPKENAWGPLTLADHAAREARKREASLTIRAVDLIQAMRRTLDEAGQASRKLLLVVDGSFTNGTIVRGLPHQTDLIGRTRKNAKLCAPLTQKDGKRIYGEALPTPDEMRKDASIPTHTTDLHYGGALRTIRLKEMPRVLWKDGTKSKLMRLLIVLPVSHTVVGRRKRGYNNPGYLLTTDLATPAPELIQAYLDRWQIEVLHRDLKTGLGVGQVQAFSEAANEKVHGAQVAAYAMLSLAALKTVGGDRTEALPDLPAWRKRKPPMRISQHDLITLLRNELVKSEFFAQPTAQMPKGWKLSHRETYQAA